MNHEYEDNSNLCHAAQIIKHSHCHIQSHTAHPLPPRPQHHCHWVQNHITASNRQTQQRATISTFAYIYQFPKPKISSSMLQICYRRNCTRGTTKHPRTTIQLTERPRCRGKAPNAQKPDDARNITSAIGTSQDSGAKYSGG